MLAALAVLLVFAPSALAAEPGQITGTVTNTSTAEPIDGIEVCAYTGYLGGLGCAKTEPNGEYTITGLKAGEYRVEFSARGRNYLRQFYDGKVSVAAGQTTSGIDAGMQEGAQITGRVTAASTQEPVDGLEVCAIAVSNGDAGCATTARGEYDIIGLSSGAYRVKFGGEYAHKFNYVPQFYDDKGSSGEAQAVSVLDGSVTSGIDAQMREGGRIAGTVSLPAGGLNPHISAVDVCATTLTGEFSGCGNPTLDGEYAIEGLASGEYTVGFFSTGLGYLPQYYDDKSSLAEADPVTVTVGYTTPEVNARLSSAGEITGRVTNAATKAPIKGIQVCVEPGQTVNCAWTDSNGEYTLTELASGQYKLGFSPDNLDYLFFMRSASVTAGQVTSGVDAALTEGGRITGRVTDASTGEPIEGAEACAHEVGGYITQCGTANASGEYTITLLNGRYTVEFHSPSGHYLAQFYGGEPPLKYGQLMFSPAQELSVAAPDTVSGIDAALQPGVFEQPANTVPPSILGTAAVGGVLSCSPGSWTGDPAPTGFTYAWLRDGSVFIGGDSSYTAQSADEGHSVSCKVSAANAAGSQIGMGRAVSAGVTVAAASIGAPSGGSIVPSLSTAPSTSMADSMAPIVTMPLVTVSATKLMVSGGSVPVHVACSQATCHGSIELVVQMTARRNRGKSAVASALARKTLVLATGSFSLAEGHSRTVVLRLTAAGRKMLAHANKRHPFEAKLMLSVKSGKTTTRPVLAV